MSRLLADLRYALARWRFRRSALFARLQAARQRHAPTRTAVAALHDALRGAR